MAEKDATKEDVDAYLKEKLGEGHHSSTLGWDDVAIAWVDQGTAFYIKEYDGWESLETDLSHIKVA